MSVPEDAPRRHARLGALFAEAIEMDTQARDELLAANADLAADLKAMLEADASSCSLDESPLSRLGGAGRSMLERIGRFEIESVLQSSGVSHVYLACDRQTSERIALKALNPLFATDDGLRRLDREAEILRRLDTPRVARIVEAGVHERNPTERIPFVATEFIADARTVTQASVDVSVTLSMFEDICRTLDVVHAAGIVHRDLKPQNILVTPQGEPILIDFGIASLGDTDVESLTFTGVALGTPSYMAPEQARGLPVDQRADLWAVGITLFECLTGKRPFDRPTADATRTAILEELHPDPRRTNSKISRGLRAVLDRALEKNPNRRYSTAGELAEDISRLRNGESPRARPITLSRRVRRWLRQRRWECATIATLAIASLLLFLYVQAAQRQNAFADEPRLLRLRDRIDEHWPRRISVRPALVNWLEMFDEIVARRELHADLARGNDPRAEDHATILALIEELTPHREEIANRIRKVDELAQQTLVDADEYWRAAANIVRDDPRFVGIDLKPQEGLEPLGRDQKSGFMEFWMPETGTRPLREGAFDSGTVLTPPRESSGIVLVLLPPGSVRLGIDPETAAARPELQATGQTIGFEQRRTASFFISKFEITQGQWRRLTGENPSLYYPEEDHEGVRIDARHPVEQVTWNECVRVLRRFDMRLPTESEWEYACRAGTKTLRFTGDEPTTLAGYANLRCRAYDALLPSKTRPALGFDIDDAFELHAPVGSFLPNAWGLHDMLGNVFEWTASKYRRLGTSTPNSRAALGRYRVYRGGAFSTPTRIAFCAHRHRAGEGSMDNNRGLRAARSLN